ncbi:VCBS repeat-containing protein [Actinomadura chokoriensis]|uniref:FG-GAP-like repeat-containing protein n=1 Tax=Actinomadura chokoriensis TaxID=454156 RepID=A0ABV4R8N3_9ACTN
MTRQDRRRRTAALAAFTAVAAGTAWLTALPAQAAPRVPAMPGDFNGDGRRDLALGSPSGTVSGLTAAGFVTVVYGGSSGPDAAKRQVITQDSAGMPGVPESYDRFGSSLASADFDMDGYADLAVVAEGENNQSPIPGGWITIIYGSANGLSSRAVGFGEGAVTVSAADFDHDGKPDLAAGHAGAFAVYRNLAAGDVNGAVTGIGQGEGEAPTVATTAADFTGDGYADLAIGIEWPPIAGDDHWLRLNVYPGSASGVAGTPAFTTTGVTVESLAAGDVNGDGKADLVVGAADRPGGEVRVYPGAASGLGDPTVIDQDTEGVPDTQEPNDAFGKSVAVGDVNGDGRADVAVGAPDEAIGTTARAGAATVLYGGPDGVTGAGAQMFSQDTDGVPGGSEQNDHFGSQVALADLNGDGKAELTVGVAGENGSEGSLYMLGGTASGVTVSGIKVFSTASLGIQGRSASLGGVVLP